MWHVNLLPALRFLRLRRATIFVFLHGIEAWKPMSLRTRRHLGRVHVFLTNSDHTWKRFVDLNPSFSQARQRTVQLGIEEPADVVSPPGDTPSAVTIGRMVRSENYKGHTELIEAWPLVLEKLPDAQLHIVGEGDQEPDLRHSVAEAGLASHVHFEGKVSDEDKRTLLSQSRCLLLPSRGEGFGLVYLEAMRLGRPSLCGIDDAGREVVGPPAGGLSVDPSDRTALAEAIVELMSPGPDWEERSSRAKARYELSFTAAHFCSRLKRAIEEP